MRLETRSTSPTAVNITMSHGDMELESAANLVKPALLYADTVTIYSPATTMLQAARSFASITDVQEQLLATMEVFEGAPGLAPNAGVDLNALPGIRQQLIANADLVRMVDRTRHLSGPLLELKQFTSAMRSLFETDLMNIVGEIEEERGACELYKAIDAGVVRLGDLTTATPAESIASWVNAAMGHAGSVDPKDLVDVLWERILDMLLEPNAFPLLDVVSTELLRALEADLGPGEYSQQSLRHSAEVAAATKFMGFLPYFENLGMDEVLDLRGRLSEPLTGFRAGMLELSTEFEARTMDSEFDVEVQDAWRAKAEPALADIRASLHDHGFLKEAMSTVMQDPRRVLIEGTGGMIAAAISPLIHVGHLTAMAGAGGGIATDVLLRAVDRVQAVRRSVRRQGFYFLHRLDEAGRRAGS